MTVSMRALVLALVATVAVARAAQAANVADLGVRLNGPNVRNGEIATFQVYVANAGALPTNDVITVRLSLPSGFSFVSGGGSDFSCTPSGDSVTCVRHTPLGQGSADFPVRLNVCSTAARVSIGVSIDYSADNNLASNRESRGASVRPGVCRVVPTPTSPGASSTGTPTPTATPLAAPAFTDLVVLLSRTSSFRAGGMGSYAVVVANNGPLATNQPITIVDDLPAGLSFFDSEGDGWICISFGRTMRCAYEAPLASGTSTSFQMNLRVARNTAPSITNVVTLDYAGDTDGANNLAGRPTTIRR